MGGSKVAKGSAHLKEYIPALTKLSEKIPAYTALVECLATVISKASPESIMEAQLLLHSLRHTLGATDPGTRTQDMPYPALPFEEEDLSYLTLKELVDSIANGYGAATSRLEELYTRGTYRDVRLFAAYARAISNGASGAQYIKETIIPALGDLILPFVEAALTPQSSNILWFLHYLHERLGDAVLPRAEAILAHNSQSDVIVAILDLLAAYPKYEETISTYAAKDAEGNYRYGWTIRQGVVNALAKLAGIAKWGRIKYDRTFTPFCSDSDNDVRETALGVLLGRAREDDKWTEKILRSFAADGSSNVLYRVVEGLIGWVRSLQADDERIEQILRSFAAEGSDTVRLGALEELIKRGSAQWETDRYVGLLTSFSEDSSEDMRQRVFDAFTGLELRDPHRYETALMSFITPNQSWNIRRDTVNLLAKHAEAHWDARKSGEIFTKLCNDRDHDVRYAALSALIARCAGDWEDHHAYATALVDFCHDQDGKNARTALDALVPLAPQFNHKNYKEILLAFAKNSETHQQAIALLMAYIRQTEDEGAYIETLRGFAKDKSSEVRSLVLNSLSEIGAAWDSVQYTALLGSFVKDKDPRLRKRAFDKLLQKAQHENNNSQYEAILRLFAKDSDWTRRLAVLKTIIEYAPHAWDDVRYAAALQDYASDGDSDVRKTAVIALGDVLLQKDNTAPYEKAIEAFAQDGEWSVRLGVVKTLIALGAQKWEVSRYETALQGFAKDRDNDVRFVVQNALITHGAQAWDDDRYAAMLGDYRSDDNREVRKAAISTLAHRLLHKDNTAPYKAALEGFIKDEDRNVRLAAVCGLMAFGAAKLEHSAYQDLLRSFAKDEDELVRHEVLKAIIAAGRQGWGAAYIPLLCGFTTDDTAGVCLTACHALGADDPRAWEAYQLEALNKDPLDTFSALCVIPSAALAQKLIDEAQALLPAYKTKRDKLIGLLRVLATRDEEVGIRFLEQTLSGEFLQEIDLEDLNMILRCLSVADTPLKNEVFAAISEGAIAEDAIAPESWSALYAASRHLSSAAFFEQYQRLGREHYKWLNDIYKIEHGPIPDGKKTWDRRWATVFIDIGELSRALRFIYDDDEAAWVKLLDAAFERAGRYIGELRRGELDDPDRSAPYADALLARAFANKHPQAETYYHKFLEAGYPKPLLDRLLSRSVEGFVAPV
jgi:HEAT repeat protein